MAAQNGNFTKAAHQCFVTQPALSRAIAELEFELNTPLFIRGNKSVELTSAGKICLVEANRILAQTEKLTERVRAASEGVEGHISIGYIFLGDLVLFHKRLKDLSFSAPNIAFETIYDSLPAVKARLISGELDLAVLPRFSRGELPPHQSITLLEEGLYALVHTGHPLFQRESVRLPELKDERFVLYDWGELSELNNACIAACQNVGFSPEVVGYGKKIGDIIMQSKMKNAICLVSFAISDLESEDIHIIPISDCTAGFDTVIVRLLDNPNLFAASFFSFLET